MAAVFTPGRAQSDRGTTPPNRDGTRTVRVTRRAAENQALNASPPPVRDRRGRSKNRRRPTLPGPCGPSTIGAEGLNGRVRDGYAWFPFAIATKRIRCVDLLSSCAAL